MDVSKRMDIDQTAVSHWESGKFRPSRKYHKKLAKLYTKTAYYKKYFQEAFTMSPEADVKQEEQDAMLREIWGEELVPHKDRYPYCKEFSYKKGRKEWR